jgi:glyoxylase-like metal-dependent hydrolase (beta-lactamase superfamily II)
MLKKCFIVIPLFCFFLVSFLNATTNGTHEIKVGDFSVIAITDTSFDMPADLIKNGSPEEIKKYMPEGKALCSDNVFVIKSAKQTILVDAGNGGNLLTNLKSVGISPDSITMVLITHGHYDHVTGLIKEGKTVFSKAKICFSEKEKTLYEDNAIAKIPAEYKQYFLPANQVLKIYGNQIKTFAFGETISEGITSVDMSGHTAGHSGFMVESKGQKLLISGDFLHISQIQFPHPEYSLIFDLDMTLASKMRKQLLEKMVKEKLLICATHISFPGIGYVSAGTPGFTFLPAK